MSSNRSMEGQLLWHGPLCIAWRQDLEGAIFHLANCFLLLGFMGGSGVYGCFYLFGFLGTGYLCCVLWGWFGACGLDIVLWSVLLAMACVVQLAHLVYRLREDTLPEELELLYKTLCLPLQVPLPAYKEIVHCCEEQVLTLATEQTYAVEGETPIDRLSLLLSGRVRVSQDGQFLHYIFPYQFMDSPEWESLHPSEEGVFQLPELLSGATLKLCPGDRRPWLQPRLLNCKGQWTILYSGHVNPHRMVTRVHTPLLTHWKARRQGWSRHRMPALQPRQGAWVTFRNLPSSAFLPREVIKKCQSTDSILY
ncbi:popeye domain-containing protein 2 isoform X4 [Bubalus kerabau]|uniref:popeye domain-containing protein 2 isoform X4 n=1 Tax=Bubalus carabanensis TaxID=3119969 RepID=UPI00042CB9B9|nr:popeye domain-containing protein 2 isoform X4 [Bubalus bubalis]XP_055424267.1 popeye domain-containing protein 2 isoform X4 [Bubalus carabanensis]